MFLRLPGRAALVVLAARHGRGVVEEDLVGEVQRMGPVRVDLDKKKDMENSRQASCEDV